MSVEPEILSTISDKTPGSVRSTVTSFLASRRVPKEVRNRLLSHEKSGVEYTNYQDYDFMPELREAMGCWHEALMGKHGE